MHFAAPIGGSLIGAAAAFFIHYKPQQNQEK